MENQIIKINETWLNVTHERIRRIDATEGVSSESWIINMERPDFDFELLPQPWEVHDHQFLELKSECIFLNALHLASHCTINESTKFLARKIYAIGYLLHLRKIVGHSPAVYVYGPQASGKSLFFNQAINKILSSCTIYGDNSKALNGLKPSHEVIIFEDLKTRRIEKYFELITGGINIERRGKEFKYLPFELVPKTEFIASKTPEASLSTMMRIYLVELSDFFYRGYTPESHFGKVFFKQFDDGDWNRFYNTMFYCIKYYLECLEINYRP